MGTLGGLAGLFYVDQTEARALCLDAINALPADPHAPGYGQAVELCLATMEAVLSDVRLSGKGRTKVLLVLVRSQLAAGNRQGAVKVVRGNIPDRRKRPIVTVAPLLGLAALALLAAGPLRSLPWRTILWGLGIAAAAVIAVPLGLLMLVGIVNQLLNPDQAEAQEHLDRLRPLVTGARLYLGEVSVEAEARYDRLRELAQAARGQWHVEICWMNAADEMLPIYRRLRDLEGLRALRADAESVLAAPGGHRIVVQAAKKLRDEAAAAIGPE